MTVFIDENYYCHVDDQQGYIPIDVEMFDGKCREYIESYVCIPEGHSMLIDGYSIEGFSVFSAKNFKEVIPYQEQYEEDLDTMMPLEEVAELIEEVYNSDLELIEE